MGSGRKRGRGGGGGMAAQVFAQLDTNEDGSLSIGEFGKGRRYRSVSAPEILEAFKAVDADENDAISSGEFSASFGGAGRGGRRRGGTD